MTDKTWITVVELNKQIHLPSEAYLFLWSYRTSMSVEGMHNYFIQKLSRDDSRDKVSADELNGLHRSSLKGPWKRGLFTQITRLRPFYFRTNLWAEYVFKASSFEPERLSCGVFRASECSKRLRCFFRYSSMLFFYGSIPVNQYFLPRLVEGWLDVHNLLGFGSHNSLQDRTY